MVQGAIDNRLVGIGAVLFDAGGTLFRVRGSVGQVYATVAARHGVGLAAAEIEQRFRQVFHVMPPLAFPEVSPAELPAREYAWWRALVSGVFHDVQFPDFDAFFAELFAYFARGESWELFADTLPALATLRERRLRLAIVSNFDGRLSGICDGLGIAGYFDALVMSGRAGWAKPDPRIFTHALTRLGVGAGEAVHVGDSQREDLAGAQAAGLRAVLVERDAALATPGCLNDLRDLVARLA